MMEHTDEKILAFISTHLEEHTDLLVKIFREQLEENGSIDTGTLLNNLRRVSVSREAGGVVATIEFPLYGRFLDIRGSRERKSRHNRSAWEKKNRPHKRDTRWYNRNKFQGFGTLTRTLSAGIGEKELQMLREAIRMRSVE